MHLGGGGGEVGRQKVTKHDRGEGEVKQKVTA